MSPLPVCRVSFPCVCGKPGASVRCPSPDHRLALYQLSSDMRLCVCVYHFRSWEAEGMGVRQQVHRAGKRIAVYRTVSTWYREAACQWLDLKECIDASRVAFRGVFIAGTTLARSPVDGNGWSARGAQQHTTPSRTSQRGERAIGRTARHFLDLTWCECCFNRLLDWCM